MADEILVPIRNETDIVTARQEGRSLAARLGFTSANQALVATAISELARNIVQYARTGEIRLARVEEKTRVGIRVVASDKGPGIGNLETALQDGFSTSRGLGLGLPGTRRLMDDFHIDSQVGRGTTITVVKWMET